MLIFDLNYLEFSCFPLKIFGGQFRSRNIDSVSDAVFMPGVGTAQFRSSQTAEANGFLGASSSGQIGGYIVKTKVGIATGSSSSSESIAE